MLSRLRPLRVPMRYCLAPPQQCLLISRNFSTPLMQKVNTTLSWFGKVSNIAGWAGIGISLYVLWTQRGLQYGPVLQNNLRKKIHNSSYPAKEISLYIKRRGLPDIMKMFNPMGKQKTVVVCGPRGSGKSVAVQNRLTGEARVIVATVVGEDDFHQKLASAITESLGVYTNADVNHNEVVVNALKTFQGKKKYERPPILVVEVNEKFTSPQAFQRLLLVLKEWGHDKGLIYPVVVLSTSRAAFGLELSMDTLRAHCVGVGDLHKDEAELYIKRLCKELKLVEAHDEGAVSKCAQNVVDTIGCRLLHLDAIADRARDLQSTTTDSVSLKDLEDLSVNYERRQKNDSRRALQKLYRNFPKEKIKGYFFKNPGAAVDLDDFSASVGMDIENFVDKLSLIEPHPFYVHPDNRTVSVGSVFFQKVIDEDK